jgi:hypothetical protein
MLKLKGGTANLEHSRPAKEVKSEVRGFLAKHQLDFLCTQESKDYRDILGTIPGYEYITVPRNSDLNADCGILVSNDVLWSKVKYHEYGDGWITVTGDNHKPATQVEVKLNDWLKVRSVHLPTPSDWVAGQLVAPAERKDDLIASMNGLKQFFRWPSTKIARCAVGDWNEPPFTYGKYTPDWLAETTGSRIACPSSIAGHGRIDYVVFKGAVVTDILKDSNYAEKSDHNWVVFEITKDKLK